MYEDSDNSNSKKNFNFFDEISSNLNNSEKPKELLNRLYSKMNLENSHNTPYQEKNIPKRN